MPVESRVTLVFIADDQSLARKSRVRLCHYLNPTTDQIQNFPYNPKSLLHVEV